MKFKEDMDDSLPFYLLTQEAKDHLKKCIRDFNNDNYKNNDFYFSPCDSQYLQGDAILGFEVVNFETMEKGHVLGLVISNTCDIATSNSRKTPVRISYSPIMKLSQYKAALLSGGIGKQQVEDILTSIRRQEVSNCIYLPYCNELEDELIVQFDNIHSMPLKRLTDNQTSKRKFSLSQFGFYLLLFKLSIHFCRFHEGLERR